MIAESFIPVRVTRDHALARDWELVLVSQGLAPQVGESLEGFVVSVPDHEAVAARAALAAYDEESLRAAPEPVEPARPMSLFSGVILGELLLLFFFVSSLNSPALPWFERGSADAERILSGELWRTVTALTLHADIAHVLSNAAAAAIFFSAVCSVLGAGLGSILVLLAGAGGNWLNALAHGSSHASVGASTAVFGAVGMLGVLGMSKRRRTNMVARRKWLSVAAALALLAMLGTAGQRTDLFAHLFGFAAGALLALFAVRLTYMPGFAIQLLSGAAALTLLVYCWYLAFFR